MWVYVFVSKPVIKSIESHQIEQTKKYLRKGKKRERLSAEDEPTNKYTQRTNSEITKANKHKHNCVCDIV